MFAISTEEAPGKVILKAEFFPLFSRWHKWQNGGKFLQALIRRRLSEIAGTLEITGLSGKTKDGIIEVIAAKRAVVTGDLLKLFRLEELEALCRMAQLDEDGWSKAKPDKTL